MNYKRFKKIRGLISDNNSNDLVFLVNMVWKIKN
jgi:hypothetical protein